MEWETIKSKQTCHLKPRVYKSFGAWDPIFNASLALLTLAQNLDFTRYHVPDIMHPCLILLISDEPVAGCSPLELLEAGKLFPTEEDFSLLLPYLEYVIKVVKPPNLFIYFENECLTGLPCDSHSWAEEVQERRKVCDTYAHQHRNWNSGFAPEKFLGPFLGISTDLFSNWTVVLPKQKCQLLSFLRKSLVSIPVFFLGAFTLAASSPQTSKIRTFMRAILAQVSNSGPYWCAWIQ